MQQNKKIISIKNLFSVYNENQDNQFVSLCDINYEFEENKIYCIIGNSGSGKSTLVTHFNGLLNTKYGLIQTNVNTMGFEWNLQNLLIGPVCRSDIQKHLTHYLVDDIFCFQSKITKKIANILIQAYYKNKIKKIVKIKELSNEHKTSFGVIFDNEFDLEILNYIPLSEIDNLNQKNKITKPSFFKKISLKKVKKFKELRKQIGMVFQFPEYQLFKDTIKKDIMFGPVALGVKKEDAEKRAKFYLNKLGLGDEYLPRSPFGLSGGQKRRVAIAGILAIETPVLIFDEPTAGLDPAGEQEMMDIILNCKKEKRTVFVITHTMDHVLEIADEVIVLNDGEIIASGSAYEIFMNDEIIHETSIQTPKVISTIKKLIEKDDIFKKLVELQPKTVEQLSEQIIKILNN